jgi:hypothetical protein
MYVLLLNYIYIYIYICLHYLLALVRTLLRTVAVMNHIPSFEDSSRQPFLVDRYVPMHLPSVIPCTE